MTRLKLHDERHRVTRVGWLRAAVLGANDGIVSTASLIVGVAAASADRSEVMVAGVAGLVAGAMSMAAGEYVSVSSQSDTESADLTRERGELATQPDAELEELASLYRSRGLDAETARKTAEQLMANDALGAHARDARGMSVVPAARPIQAASPPAATFPAGAGAPLALAAITPADSLAVVVSAGSLVGLALLGAVGAQAGGAPPLKAAIRVTFWGALAMALTAGIGALVGAAV
ncbi:MAG: VIT family protein [Phenylobacterium sp.]